MIGLKQTVHQVDANYIVQSRNKSKGEGYLSWSVQPNVMSALNTNPNIPGSIYTCCIMHCMNPQLGSCWGMGSTLSSTMLKAETWSWSWSYEIRRKWWSWRCWAQFGSVIAELAVHLVVRQGRHERVVLKRLFNIRHVLLTWSVNEIARSARTANSFWTLLMMGSMRSATLWSSLVVRTVMLIMLAMV